MSCYDLLASANALPSDRWFEVKFDIDLSARTGSFHVDHSPRQIKLANVAIQDDAPRFLVLGPRFPNPANITGWSILYDDVVVQYGDASGRRRARVAHCRSRSCRVESR